MKIRLDKFISNNTNISRSNVTKFIKNGYVTVNKKLITEPSSKIDENDEVLFDNEKINKLDNIYIVLNKPKGYLCTTSFNESDPSILELLEEYKNIKGLHIVGRLDKDTTGLVILTNDGKFTHNIKSPKYNIEKEYEVTLQKTLTQSMVDNLKKPITMDGKLLKEIIVNNVNGNKCNLIIKEGKYHQIKRLFSMVGNEVIDLNRIRVANIELSNLNLKLGKYKLIGKIKLENETQKNSK